MKMKYLQGGNIQQSVVLGRQWTGIPLLPPQPSHQAEHAIQVWAKLVDACHAQV
jgi:hypothetical protein